MGTWTGSRLVYDHVDHLGTPIRGTHGSSDSAKGIAIGDEAYQEFHTPYGMQPTQTWFGLGGTANRTAVGAGNYCGVSGFTDHVPDCETGLTYMQARHYDPVSSRFLRNDPVGFLTDGRTGMVNRYSYTLNDPVNMWDPDGELPTAAIGAIAGGLIGGTVSVFAEYRSQSPGERNWKAILAKGAVGAGAGAATGAFYGSGAGVVAAVGANAHALAAGASIAIDGAAGEPKPSETEAIGSITAAAIVGATGVKLPGGDVVENTIANSVLDAMTVAAGSGLRNIPTVDGEEGDLKDQLDEFLNPGPDIEKKKCSSNFVSTDSC